MLDRAAIVVAELSLSADTFPTAVGNFIRPGHDDGGDDQGDPPEGRPRDSGRETLPAGLQEQATRIRSIAEQRAELFQLSKDAGADHVVVVETADLLVHAEIAWCQTAVLHEERVTVKAKGRGLKEWSLRGSAGWALCRTSRSAGSAPELLCNRPSDLSAEECGRSLRRSITERVGAGHNATGPRSASL